jgi:hypothetical protein
MNIMADKEERRTPRAFRAIATARTANPAPGQGEGRSAPSDESSSAEACLKSTSENKGYRTMTTPKNPGTL